MTTREKTTPGTASRILDVAERLVQIRGFNGFSYADVAAELGITTAALHYHFAGKAELGEALVARYTDRFGEALAEVDLTNVAAPDKLRAYASIYTEVLRLGRMCLCGMLAADFETLPSPMQVAVVRFFDANETWLASTLTDGMDEGTLRFSGAAEETARMIVSTLEGAMLIARPYGDVARFETAAARMLEALITPA